LLEAGIAGAKKVVMRGTAHLPSMEQPAVFNRIVREFLAGLPKRA
jgi:pimeloyl-ACP methyl ester carboxylesterase